jgi:hypothetical protein
VGLNSEMWKILWHFINGGNSIQYAYRDMFSIILNGPSCLLSSFLLGHCVFQLHPLSQIKSPFWNSAWAVIGYLYCLDGGDLPYYFQYGGGCGFRQELLMLLMLIGY